MKPGVKRVFRSRVALWCVGSLALIAIVFIAQTACIVVDGLCDELQKADIIVVFGNKVELNGEPSPRLRARLERAAEVYRQGLAPRILVSGGTGKEGFDEALVMRDWLVQHGIKTDAILVDQNGYDSAATAEASKAELERFNGSSALVVTQYWHITRAKLALRKAGIIHVYGAHARYFGVRDVYSLIREFPAFWAYYLR